MQPYFTSNDADVAKLESVYVKERNPPATVTEASLNTVAVFGRTLKGPVGRAVEITTDSRFEEVFGGGYYNGTLVNHIWKARLNKGFSKLVVARVAPSDAVKASFTLESLADGSGTQVLRVDASSAGAWGNSVYIKVAAATDGVANHFNLLVKNSLTGKITTYEDLDIVGGDNTLTVLGDDDGNLVTLTKLLATRPVNTAGITGVDADGFLYLGQTVASFVSVVGSDGSALVEGDYYGTDKGLDLVKDYKGVGIVFCAEFSSANLRTQIETAAAAVSDRMFLVSPNSETVNVSSAVTDVANHRSDRIVYCYNHAYTVDPEVGTEVLTNPESWMACVLANTDVDIHPGEEDTKRFLAGISRLYRPALSRQDYVDLRAAGISAMEIDLGSPVFVSGVTTSLTKGKTEITRRRMADFIQLSVAESLRFSVKKKNTAQQRVANVGMIVGFLKDLYKNARVVDNTLSFEKVVVVDGEILNTDTSRAQGIEKILLRVKLMGHMLHVVLETELGTGVTISLQ